jgi:protein-S-isoprenylcysteine O-methyltransferase Ste14
MPAKSWGRDEWQAMISLAITLVVMGVVMFWPAGTFAWPNGWWFIASFRVAMAISIVVLWRLNPEIFAARKGIAAGTKAWDYVFLVLVLGGFVAILPVAGFDYRFGWSQLPGPVVVAGHGVMLIGFAGTAWAQAVNRHFEPSVRIQSDRGHTVISSGPYAYIRHPGYVFGSLMAIGVALALGSGRALFPALLVMMGLVARTVLEDAMLQAELAGYAEYARRVKARWLPGVW